ERARVGCHVDLPVRVRSRPGRGHRRGHGDLVSVVEYQPRAMAAPSRAWVDLLPVAVELAKAVADTEFVPKALRHNPAAIAACILYGDEVGLGPMQSLAKIAMVDGKPTLFAEAQRGLVLSRGHEM